MKYDEYELVLLFLIVRHSAEMSGIPDNAEGKACMLFQR